MIGFIVIQLVDGEYLPIVREEHGVEYKRGNGFHGVHVASSKYDVVVQLGIDDFDIDENHFSL
jgi:hypothetical protein